MLRLQCHAYFSTLALCSLELKVVRLLKKFPYTMELQDASALSQSLLLSQITLSGSCSCVPVRLPPNSYSSVIGLH
jgi:hypothetical protein